MGLAYCPTCSNLLEAGVKNQVSCLVCQSCSYSVTVTKAICLEKVHLKERRRDAVCDDIEPLALPKKQEKCPSCEENLCYYEDGLTGILGEGSPTYFICTHCKHKWKKYLRT